MIAIYSTWFQHKLVSVSASVIFVTDISVIGISVKTHIGATPADMLSDVATTTLKGLFPHLIYGSFNLYSICVFHFSFLLKELYHLKVLIFIFFVGGAESSVTSDKSLLVSGWLLDFKPS